MHQLSYDTADPIFTVNGLRFSVQLFTFENVYGLASDRCTVEEGLTTSTVRCDLLTWAGASERAPGHVEIGVSWCDGTTRISVRASCTRTIRCIKVTLIGIPSGPVVGLRETPSLEVPEEGLVLRYPSGWRGLFTPLIAVASSDNGVWYVRSLDTQVREKRFAFVRRESAVNLELIFEDLATDMTNSVDVPLWEIGLCHSTEDVMRLQMNHVETAYGLLPWDQRPDVPVWARQISLVAAIHCQHWSGFVFNDYAQVLSAVQWLSERIDPCSILAYLPGWEGRYYWQYGDYRPDPRMGGEDGFVSMVDGIHAVGARVMPMFGIDHVNRGLPNFEQWGAPAVVQTPGGFGAGGSVDWDTSRHHDHGWESALNPGAPTWQNRLVDQVRHVIERYGVDGVFLDISAGWTNDPNHEFYAGVQQLVTRIRTHHPEILVAGEGWYDAMGAVTPLMQSGHTDGALHWHDEPYAPFFDTYNRSFVHLCLGDSSRGSTGVHELGHNATPQSPIRRGIIPTVTIVNGTIDQAGDELEAIIADAKRYSHAYLPALDPA